MPVTDSVEVFVPVVERTPVLEAGDLDAAWLTYRTAMAAIVDLAAMKQVIDQADFMRAMRDARVDKYVIRDADGAVCAISTVTTALDTENLTAAFFEQRYPGHYRAGRLRYLGFLAVRPDAQRAGLINRVVRAIVDDVGALGGVVAFDVCGHNDETFRFARTCAVLAARIRPSVLHTIDVQTYYAVEMPAIE